MPTREQYLSQITIRATEQSRGPGINCGSDCSESIEAGTPVTLTATPQPGRVFVGTSTLFGCPPYSPSGYSSAVTCNYTINSDEGGSFYWAYASYSITASTEGTGSGTVAGAGTYAYSSFATLTATPSAGSVFAGWQTSGAICARQRAKYGKYLPYVYRTDRIKHFPLPFALYKWIRLKYPNSLVTYIRTGHSVKASRAKS